VYNSDTSAYKAFQEAIVLVNTTKTDMLSILTINPCLIPMMTFHKVQKSGR